MTDKEMLANLLHFAEQDCICTDCYVCDYFQTKFCKPTKMADYLLANGVTFQKWIPVTERLPDKDGHFLACRLIFDNPGVEVFSFAKDGRKVDEQDFEDQWDNVWYFYDSEYGFVVCNSVTHWMPLPNPPKENADEVH